MKVHTSKDTAEQIRTRLRAARDAMGVARRQQDSEAICTMLSRWMDTNASAIAAHAGSRGLVTVAGFWPLAGEPDLTPVLRALDARGVRIALPVMMGSGRPLEFHCWHGNDTLQTGPFGVMQPVRSEPLVPDIILVPTLGYTRKGDRLGYGAGFYDRTLAAIQDTAKAPITIGIGWREGLITPQDCDYTPEPHDMPLTAILTPDGWLPAAPGALTP